MAEAKDDTCVVPLDVYGDEKLKQLLERNIPGIEVICYKHTRLELKGSKKHVEKAKACFCEVLVDRYIKQLIITEDLPLIYLNEHLRDEVCYLVKNREVVYACIPHHKRQEYAERVSKLIERNIIKQNLENRSEDLSSKINDLMISHSGKIICIEDSILVYTADIRKDVDEVIGKRFTGREAEDKTTQDAYDVCIDEDCKRFIETHCPGVKVRCSDKGFSLHYNKSAMQDRGQIKIENLDIDNRKLQLILTEDKAKNFLNKQLKASGIVGYVMTNDGTVCSLTLPGNRVDFGRIATFIDENILVKQLDNQDDSNLLIDYSGKLTHLVQENKTYLVFTKDIEMEIASFLHEQVNPASLGLDASGCINKMKQDEIERDGIRYTDAYGGQNRKASDLVRVTKSDTNHTSLRGEGKSDKNALTKGMKEHEDFNNAGMIQQAGRENGGRPGIKSSEDSNNAGMIQHAGRGSSWRPGIKSSEESNNAGMIQQAGRGSSGRPGFKGSEESNNEIMKRQTGRETFEAKDHDSIHFENDLQVINCMKINLDADVAEYIFTQMGSFISELEKRNSFSIENRYGTIMVSGQCDRTAVEKVINRIHEMARSVIMDSSYIVEDEVKATQIDTFKDLKDRLKGNGTKVQLYPCDEVRTVNVFMYKGVEIQLIHGSAADCKQTEVILCPLDANLKPMSAAGHHIMIKGGELLRGACHKVIEKRGNLPDCQIQVLNETGQLQVKSVFAMAVHNLYESTSATEENIRKKIKHLFCDMINKQSKSVTIPLEFGQRIPVAVMLNACCKGLKDFLSERTGTILNRVNLCCVNDSHIPLIAELMKVEFPHENQNTGPATDKVKTTQQEIYGPSRVCVVLNTESLIDQRVDAIVVPVNSKVDLTKGAVSNQVLDAAGGSIQSELSSIKHQGIGPMEVTHTRPGRLPMKHILYSNLPKFTDGSYGLAEMRLGKVMENIFACVKQLGIKSLALPSLGTGGLKYPTEIVAIEMMRSIYLHAAQSGVNTVTIVVYKVSPEQQRIFEKILREYQDTIKLTYKACMTKPIFVEISNPDWKHCNKVVETSTEVRMADTIIYLRKASSYEINGEAEEITVTIENMLRKVDTVRKKRNRLTKLYFLVSPESLKSCVRRTKDDLSRRRIPDKSGLGITTFFTSMISGSQLGLEWHVKESKVPFSSGANLIMCSDNEEKLQTAVQAVRSKFSEYGNALFAEDSGSKDGDDTANVDRGQPPGADRDPRSIGNRDQTVSTDRCQRSFDNRDQTVGADRDQRAHGNQDQTGSGSTSISHKIPAKSTPEDHYQKIDDISDEEEVTNRRKRATNQNREHSQQALIAKDSVRKDRDETANVDRGQSPSAVRAQRSFGNRDQPPCADRDQTVGADRDQISIGNQDQTVGAERDQRSRDQTVGADRHQRSPGNQDQTILAKSTSDDHYQKIDDISDEEQVTNQKREHSQHVGSDDDCDDSVKTFSQISGEVGSTFLRHLSKRKLQSFMASLEKKSIHAEYKNETIKVSVPYDSKENLAVALQKKLSRLDKNVYYVHDVTPQMFNLLELYQRQTAKQMKYEYVAAEQEIKIGDSLEVYETIKEKCKMFLQYQIDNIDVSKASVSVKDKIREYNSTREPRFENVLLEVLKGNKAINIHYPVIEQNSALEMKNILLFQLGLVKPTGRRNRRFDNFTSLQETFKQNDKTWDTHEVITEEGSQYGDRFTSASPSMPSRNTNGDIPSYTTSYNNSNQRDSNYGNRPSDMESSRPRGKATLRPEASSFSSKGTYSLPVSGRHLDVQTDKTKAKEEPIKEAVYCTEKNLVIKVYNGNILKLDVDCIVNAANDGLFHGAGVAGAISRAAGREFDKESRAYINDNGSLDVGQCISTGAGRLNYRHVLHAVGPQWGMYEDKADCQQDLMMTIYNTLRRAEVLKMKSVAIPSISSGIFGVPWNVCAEQYGRGVERFEEDSQGMVQEVHFVDINSDILKEIQSVFSHMFKVLASNED